MNVAIWTANLLGWPILQIVIARYVLSVPLSKFAEDRPLFRLHSWEQTGRIYRRGIVVHKWKSSLPDGGPWFGGFSKKKLAGRNHAYLRMFILETCRAEFAHWCMLCSSPLFFLWNPPWACWVMAAYGILANVPFIVVQRYNRLALMRICARMETMAAKQQGHAHVMDRSIDLARNTCG